MRSGKILKKAISGTGAWDAEKLTTFAFYSFQKEQGVGWPAEVTQAAYQLDVSQLGKGQACAFLIHCYIMNI